MNVKTWISICRITTLIFPIFIVGIFVRTDHWFRYVSIPATVVVVVVCLWSAVLALKSRFGTLYFGCPFCRVQSKVVVGYGRGILLKCPQCGDFHIYATKWGLGFRIETM